MDVTIGPPAPTDREGWERLYTAYRAHYGQSPDALAAEAVWGWINDPNVAFEARVARKTGGRLVGMIHFREVLRPLRGSTGGYIDDMIVAEDARGGGVADALVDAVSEAGRSRGWSNIRWITSDDNYRARGFYDRIARRTMMLTYEIKL